MVRKKTSKTSKTKGKLVKDHEQFVEFDWKLEEPQVSDPVLA